jgi:hypothetical protein
MVVLLFDAAGLPADKQSPFLADFLSLIELIDRRHGCTDSLIKDTIDAEKAADAKNTVAGWDDLDALKAEIAAKAGLIDALRRNLTLEILPAAKVREAELAARNPKSAAEAGNLKQLLAFASESLKAVLDALKSEKEVQALLEALVTDPLYIALQLVPDTRVQGEAALEALTTFREAMEEVDEPRELGVVAYDSANVIAAKVTITPSKDRKTAAEALKRPLGEFKLKFEPYSLVQLGVDAVMIYSFTKSSDFDVEGASGDKFKIVEKEADQFKGRDVAVMLSIVPTRWADSDFYPAFQIGVNPEKDLGLYAGFGVHFTKVFSFGVGAAFEEVERLPKGLNPNDILDSKDKFKTETRFKGGWYLHLSATATLGKKKD